MNAWLRASWTDFKLYADCSKKGFVPAGPGNSPDPQSCNIKVGSWVYDARHINLTAFAGTDQLSLEDMSPKSRTPSSSPNTIVVPSLTWWPTTGSPSRGPS